eukprot:scaffold368174_cov27-Prasinocladus_malaysianus.AAC.1
MEGLRLLLGIAFILTLHKLILGKQLFFIAAGNEARDNTRAHSRWMVYGDMSVCLAYDFILGCNEIQIAHQ